MTTNAVASLTIPRWLAIELLHTAQIAQGPVFGRVFAPRTESDAWRWRPGRGDVDEAGAWAEYQYDSADPGAQPVAVDFVGSATLRLMPVLTTKGVLQLRIWRSDGGRVIECPLALADET